MTTLVPVALGLVFGAGLVVAVAAWRGFEVRDPPRGSGLALRRLVGVGSLPPVLTGLVALALTRWPVGALLAGGGVAVLPRVFAGRASRQARLARVEALAAWAEQLRDTLSGAAGLEETIVATIKVAPAPIRPELTRLAHRLQHDQLVPSLRDFADALADPLADLIVSALILAADKQVKDLAALLGTLADAARDQAAMQLRVDAGRARTRTAVQIITIFTVGFALVMVTLNRGYLDPFDSFGGQLVLAAVGACFGGAFWMMEHMSRAPEPERVLVRAGAGVQP
ncbi:MAG: type II secretion system F family protein [Acidimicrobiia bacterium]